MTYAGKRIHENWHRREKVLTDGDGKGLPFSKTIENSLPINRAYPPSADIMIPETRHPAWTFESIAAKLGVTRDLFITPLQASDTGFDPVEQSDIS
jgi:hypothetical protein